MILLAWLYGPSRRRSDQHLGGPRGHVILVGPSLPTAKKDLEVSSFRRIAWKTARHDRGKLFTRTWAFRVVLKFKMH
jgi:hypothetical protein